MAARKANNTFTHAKRLLSSEQDEIMIRIHTQIAEKPRQRISIPILVAHRSCLHHKDKSLGIIVPNAASESAEDLDGPAAVTGGTRTNVLRQKQQGQYAAKLMRLV